jgi:superfamily II RNA helicase
MENIDPNNHTPSKDAFSL